MGHAALMMGQAMQGSLGDAGAPAADQAPKTSPWPWLLGAAAVAGVVYAATRDGSMSNPADYYIVEVPGDGVDYPTLREAKAKAYGFVENREDNRAIVYTASDDPEHDNERAFVYAVWRGGEGEIVETTEPAVVAAAYDVMYGRGGRSHENPANHYYVIDIGGDAMDQPTKRAAVAAAKRLVKQGVSTKAIVFRASFDENSMDNDDFVYAFWETTSHGRGGGLNRTFEESTDPVVIAALSKKLNGGSHENPVKEKYVLVDGDTHKEIGSPVGSLKQAKETAKTHAEKTGHWVDVETIRTPGKYVGEWDGGYLVGRMINDGNGWYFTRVTS